jgi:hypothetical protein
MSGCRDRPGGGASRARQAFPWAHLRTRFDDGTGTRLTLIWPEAEVLLTGRNLDQLEDDMQRCIVAEFRQVEPNAALDLAEGAPVIERMEIRAL